MNTCVRRISMLLLILLAISVQLLPEMLWAAKAQPNRATSAPVVKVPPPTPQPKPDLAITSMSWSYPLKEGYVVGQNSILNFSIQNLGNAPSGNFKIKFTCPSCPPSMTGERNVTSLAPGAAYNANWPSGSATPEKWTAGSYTLQTMVDPDHVVDDSNQANNQKNIVFIVNAKYPALKFKPNQGPNVHVLGGTGKREVVIPLSACPPGGTGTGQRELVIALSACPPGGVGTGQRELVIPLAAVGPGGVGTGKRELTIPMQAGTP